MSVVEKHESFKLGEKIEMGGRKKVWRISRFGARGWHQEATLWQANLGTGFIRRSS